MAIEGFAVFQFVQGSTGRKFYGYRRLSKKITARNAETAFRIGLEKGKLGNSWLEREYVEAQGIGFRWEILAVYGTRAEAVRERNWLIYRDGTFDWTKGFNLNWAGREEHPGEMEQRQGQENRIREIKKNMALQCQEELETHAERMATLAKSFQSQQKEIEGKIEEGLEGEGLGEWFKGRNFPMVGVRESELPGHVNRHFQMAQTTIDRDLLDALEEELAQAYRNKIIIKA